MKTTESLDADTIINLVPEYIYWLDRHAIYQGANVRYLQLLELNSIDELIGKRSHQLTAVLEAACAEAINKNNQEIIAAAQNTILEEVIILKNGDKKIFLSHKFPLQDLEGKVFALLVTSIDITEHKNYLKQQIEQKELTVEKLIANMPGHVYWKNREGIYLGCNNSQARSLGFRYGHEVVGKTDFDLSEKKKALKFREIDKCIIQKGITETIEEIAQVDGKEAVVISRKTPLKDKNGNVIGILGVSIDITDRKKAERELDIAKEIAESASRAKTEFLRNMRHDLRTPFSGILGMAQLLEEKETDPVKKDGLTDIAEAAQALLNHLNEILEFIKAESGESPVLEKEFNIYSLLNEVSNMLLPAAKKQQLDFELRVDKDLPPYLIGDNFKTIRILINLIANAIKFTKEGHVYLQAHVYKKYKAENKVLLQFIIEDTGPGIPEDKQEVIFAPLSRPTSSHQGTYLGPGLGLKIVKQFLDDLGGQLKLKSTMGEGTLFNILIPYKISLFKKEKKQKPESHQQVFEGKILLVEDSVIAAKVAKAILLDFGCEVDIAVNGKMALELVEKEVYDFIFMDIGLPDISGYDVTKFIRSHQNSVIASVPIVALTGYDDGENQEPYLKIGINHILSKPLTKSIARETLCRFLHPQKPPIKLQKPDKPAEDSVSARKIVDVDYAVNLLGGNRDIVEDMLSVLCESLPEELNAMRVAYQNQNWQDFGAIIHKLKGSAGYCGALHLKAICTELDQLIHAGSVENISAFYQKVITEVEAVQTFLSAYLADLST